MIPLLIVAVLGAAVRWEALPPFTSLVVAILVVCGYFAFFSDTSYRDWR
jgi:hypothetical protein